MDYLFNDALMSSKYTGLNYNFEVRHPRCVGSITKESLCTTRAV